MKCEFLMKNMVIHNLYPLYPPRLYGKFISYLQVFLHLVLYVYRSYFTPISIIKMAKIQSELVQLKLNIETSVTKVSSGHFRRKRLAFNERHRAEGWSLPPSPLSVSIAKGGSAILSTGDYRHRSKVRGTTPTCRSGSLTIGSKGPFGHWLAVTPSVKKGSPESQKRPDLFFKSSLTRLRHSPNAILSTVSMRYPTLIRRAQRANTLFLRSSGFVSIPKFHCLVQALA